MKISLNNTDALHFNQQLIITGSKSESNRLLILQALYPNLVIENLSNAKDTLLLKKALSSKEKTIDIGHAGTAMRFLTAYFAVKKESDIVLTGSDRMQQRPIKILVNALQDLGADITYLKENGFPPIKIKGAAFIKNRVRIDGNVSSQYISALLLIAPSLENGLSIELNNKITSIPYIEMTMSLLHKIGVKTNWEDNIIRIFPKKEILPVKIAVESDWSSASYFYSLVALSENGKVSLSHFKEDSLQGDKSLSEIYAQFGVKTTFNEEGILLEKIADFKQKKQLTFHLIKTPDIAQTIAVTCFGLGILLDLTGLHTLKIKETDRLEALKTELGKMGAKVRITADSFHLLASEVKKDTSNFTIETYDDHRMAMAFAPLSLLFPISIKDAMVVEKSYPDFWLDLEKILS